MARLFAVLSGSAPVALTTDYFDQRSISNGTLKRTGLIDSRSALSTDIYNEVDSVNRDGTRGIYFPPDLITTDSSTFISGSIYTSSVAGIVIPANYRTRPTASIVSTQTTLVGPTNPLDSASAIYNTYLSASVAVKNVLDSITGGGPYGRLGLNQSRTLHSVWHDEQVAYFAWDDFTPGTATFNSPTFGPTAGGVLYITASSTGLSASIAWAGTYSADTLGATDLGFTLSYSGSSTALITSTTTTVNATSTYDWSLDSAVSSFDEGSASPLFLDFTASAKFYDVTIPTHAGAEATQSFANAIEAHRLLSINNNRVFVALTSDAATCYQITRPVYSTFAGTFPGDNPSSFSTSQISKAFNNINPGPTAPPGFEPTSGELPGHSEGGNFWMVYASTTGIPNSGDEICPFQDGIRTGGSCVAAPACFTTTTTTTTTTGACTSFSYSTVASLAACDASPYNSTGYSNTGLNVGSRLYTNAGCSVAFGAGFIQISSTNYETDSSGFIIGTAAVTC